MCPSVCHTYLHQHPTLIRIKHWNTPSQCSDSELNILMPPACQCSDHPTLSVCLSVCYTYLHQHPTISLVIRIKHLNAPSQCSKIFNPSTGYAREEDIAIAMLWFSCFIFLGLDSISNCCVCEIVKHEVQCPLKMNRYHAFQGITFFVRCRSPVL